MRIVRSLDHLVLTVRDIEVSREFYNRVLGMEPLQFGDGRHAVRFGEQKINLHAHGDEIVPNAAVATPGSADLCFLLNIPLPAMMRHLEANGVDIIDGPVPRTGACGPIVSLYFRDPDGNLIEVSRATD